MSKNNPAKKKCKSEITDEVIRRAYESFEPRPPLTVEYIKAGILQHHLENRNNPITLEEIRDKFLLSEYFQRTNNLIQAKVGKLVPDCEDPKVFATIMAIDPNFLFSDTGKAVVMDKYRKLTFGDASARKKAKAWLNIGLIPKKRGRKSEVRKARKIPPEVVAELCWNLWGFFEVIKLELEDLKKKQLTQERLINKLFEIRTDLPKEKSWRAKIAKLLSKHTPQKMAISETALVLYISEASVTEAVHPRKKGK